MTTKSIRVIGLDPGLRYTGWGVVDIRGTLMSCVASGVAQTSCSSGAKELQGNTSVISPRLLSLYSSLSQVAETYKPDVAAVEQVFVNRDANSSMKLGHARAISLLIAEMYTMQVHEYAPNTIKKAVVGHGHAGKHQIRRMLSVLFPKAEVTRADAADAIAIAVCHVHHMRFNNSMQKYLQ